MKNKNLLKVLMLTALISGCGNNTSSSTNVNTSTSSNNSISTSENVTSSSNVQTSTSSSTDTSLSSTTSTNTEVKVNGIEIVSENNISSIKEEETLQLTAVVYPENADQSVTWSSEDNLVATVSETGLVTGVSRGQVVIYATSNVDSNIVGEFYLTVEEKPAEVIAPESITLVSVSGATTLKTSETLELRATVLPEGANPQVKWSTSDESIAKVERGIVTGVGVGNVTISAVSAEDATVKASIDLVVEQGETSTTVEWDKVNYTTHAEYMAAENDTTIKVKGVVTHVLPEDTEDNTVSYYIQNGEEGFYVYAQDTTKFTVEEGKVYEVGGFKKYYYRGQHEIVNVEHFVELNENITSTTVSLNEKDVTTDDVTKGLHGAFVSGDAVVSETPNVQDKTHSFAVVINGKTIDLCVDKTVVNSTEFAAINAKLANVFSGSALSFKGIMSAFGYGTPAPQILITSADDITVQEATKQQIVDNQIKSFTVPSTVDTSTTKIELQTSVEGYEDIEVKWESGNTTVISNAGEVTHPSTDTTVELTVTLTYEDATASKTFSVLVYGTSSEFEVLHTLDFEGTEEGTYGSASVTPGYSQTTLSLGNPATDWYINNSLIGSLDNDRKNGTWSLRMQSNKSTREASGRLELRKDYELSAIEFMAAVYGSDAAFQFVIEYSLDNGTTWVDSGNTYTVESTTLEKYRITLPEGTDRVAIQLVEGVGRRANIDDVKLLK